MRSEVDDPNSGLSPSCIEAWTRSGGITYVEGTRREFQYSGCFGTEDTQEQVRQKAPGHTVGSFSFRTQPLRHEVIVLIHTYEYLALANLHAL